MGANTKIEWCDHTFNPWFGCTKVSPACAHCYAENETPVRVMRAAGRETWGKGAPRHRTGRDTWRQPRRWSRRANDRTCSNGHAYPGTTANLLHGKCYQCGERWEDMPWHRPRVFCASMADVFDAEVDPMWLADLLNLIEATPNLDWLLLTKRPELWRARMGAVCEVDGDNRLAWSWRRGSAPANVWMGTTVEDQARADERIPALLEIPARVRFLSCEPLLGSVDLTAIPWAQDPVIPGAPRTCLIPTAAMIRSAGRPAINWVICGGESGTKARPMHPEWARGLRDQCAAAGVPFFFKQWGEWTNVDNGPDDDAAYDDKDHTWLTLDGRCQGVVSSVDFFSAEPIYRVGKAAAGRKLDGVEHSAFPEVRR